MLRTLAQRSRQISPRVSNVYSVRTLRKSIKNFSNGVEPSSSTEINQLIKSVDNLNATQSKLIGGLIGYAIAPAFCIIIDDLIDVLKKLKSPFG
jgi:hypothetical protein